MKWTWGDWIASGIMAGSAALGVWGGIVADELGGKVASYGMSIAFLLGLVALLAIRITSAACDYVSLYGLRIRLGKKNRPSMLQIKVWTKELVEDWSSVEKYKKCAAKSLDDKFVVFVDKERISVASRWVRGYAWGETAVVGYRPNNGDDHYVYSLFRHEVSHLILDSCGESWDEQKHHAIMKKIGV